MTSDRQGIIGAFLGESPDLILLESVVQGWRIDQCVYTSGENCMVGPIKG